MNAALRAYLPTQEQLDVLLKDICAQANYSKKTEKGFYDMSNKKLTKTQVQDKFINYEKVKAVEWGDDFRFLVGCIEVDEMQLVAFNKTTNWYACKFLTADNIVYWRMVRAEKLNDGCITYSLFRGKLNY